MVATTGGEPLTRSDVARGITVSPPTVSSRIKQGRPPVIVEMRSNLGAIWARRAGVPFGSSVGIFREMHEERSRQI